MSWGTRVLDPEMFAQQEQELAKAANPWGPRIELPTADAADPAEAVAAEPTPADDVTGQLSVAEIERRLVEDPSQWTTLLAAELQREAPRKSALRAILRTMESENVDAATIASAREMLDTL